MGFKSGSAYGNGLGLTFFDRMDALESEVRKLTADGAVTTRTTGKLQKEIKELKAREAVTTRTTKKLQDEIDSVRKANEALEKRVVTLEEISGEHKKIRERIYYVYKRNGKNDLDAREDRVILNGNAAAHEGREVIDAFHFSSNPDF